MSSRKKRKNRNGRTNKSSGRQSQTKAARKHANAQNLGLSQPSPVDEAADIRRLISEGKSKGALNKAKYYHKCLGTVESEAMLVDAYVARIGEMIDKGHTVEARALIGLVRKGYASASQRLVEMNAVIAAREGMIDELVLPLRDPGISRDKRIAIENIIKRELIDVNELARSKALPFDHPLKKAAFAVAKAFEAVTHGPVEDETIALPEIARRNPLAPWKMLVRATACFYSRDDEGCEKSLQAIDPESAPARLVPVMRAMIAGKSNGEFNGNSRLLIEQVKGNREKVRGCLQGLDSVLARKNRSSVFKMIRDTAMNCEQACPELLERLSQHISIRTWMNDLPADQVTKAMGGASLKNAYFWRLHARAAETKGKIFLACGLWEEFHKHAIHEGWFSVDGREVSVIYLHMAALLRRLPEHDFEWGRMTFERNFNGFGFYYENQPKSLLDVVSKEAGGGMDTYFLYPARLYRLASEIDPDPQTFRQWLEWVEKNASGWKAADRVTTAWHNALPDDTRPLLHMMASAEKRNALKKALGYLEKAECLNGLNPDVRRARLRLLVATTIRHLKQKKTHLAKKDLKEIEVLPQACEGDRTAFVAALRYACAMIDKEKSELSRWNDELLKLLGSELSAAVVIKGLLRACGLPEDVTTMPSLVAGLAGADLVAAVARGCALGDDMGVPFSIPCEWEPQMREFLTTKECSLDTSRIRTIAEAALRDENMELAYAASGAGFARGGADSAKFLLLRARSLPRWAMDRRDDCISVAAEVARRERDMDLLDEAIELRRDGISSPLGSFILDTMMGGKNFSMDADRLDKVLTREKEALGYPSSSDRFSDYRFGYDHDDDDYDEDDEYEDDDYDVDTCRHCDVKDCPDRKAEYVPDDSDDYDDDDDDDDDDDYDDDDDNDPIEFLRGMPKELAALFLELLFKHGGANGEVPDPIEVAKNDPELMQQIMNIMEELGGPGGSLPDFGGDWFPGAGATSRR